MDPSPVAPRFLTEADFRTYVRRLLDVSSNQGSTRADLASHWTSSVRWARNRISTVSDERDTRILLRRGFGQSVFNQAGPDALAAAVRWTEQMDRLERADLEDHVEAFSYAPPDVTYPKTHIWSEPTYQMTSDNRGAVANGLMAKAEAAGLLSAGYLDVRAGSRQLRLEDGRMCYARYTSAQCSLTVRDPDGKGSGWAGASSYDWSQIDAEQLAEVALDKCVRSRNPVRIEPGRYTVIMEPQATYDLVRQFMGGHVGGNGYGGWGSDYMDWQFEDQDWPGFPVQLPFHDGTKIVSTSQWGVPAEVGVTKIGQRLLDPRITITFDPTDPQLGDIPFTVYGDPLIPVTWWEQGVLKTLAYKRGGGPNSAKLDAQPNPGIYRMHGGSTSIEEMIATTARGLLVTRFSGVKLIERFSILCSGATRDGVWLIEHGKVKNPVTNLRFTESPLFVFNNVEQIGVSVPVFAPGCPALIPPIKVKDFSFTSIIDAV